MGTRKYTQRRRAQKRDETRARIVDATVQLHERLGAAKTSIKAIAEAAGVQRLTVYRHFPDEAALFQACTSHYLGEHPPPDPAQWADVGDAGERCHTALLAFYRYYRRTGKMWASAYRDVDEVAALQEPMSRFEVHLDRVCDDLVAAWCAPPAVRRPLRTTLRHAMRFSTWQSLKKSGLGDAGMAGLVLRWLDGVA